MTTSWKLKLKVESVEVLQGCGTMEIAKLKAFGRVGHYDIGGFFCSCFFFFLSQVDLSPLSQESPGDVQEPSGRKPSVSVVTADVGLVSMVRQGILALQLLPSNSSAGWLHSGCLAVCRGMFSSCHWLMYFVKAGGWTLP